MEYERRLDKMRYQFDKLWAKKPEPSGVMKGFEMCCLLGSGAFGKVVRISYFDLK